MQFMDFENSCKASALKCDNMDQASFRLFQEFTSTFPQNWEEPDLCPEHNDKNAVLNDFSEMSLRNGIMINVD